MPLRRLIFALALASLGACALIDEERAPLGCTPELPLKDGWLGGDGVSSVALEDGRILWLFGDSFIGEPGAKDRVHAKMIDNTVAITACHESRWSSSYHGRVDRGEPAPFFKSARAGEKYWPLSGVARADGTALVFLVRVRTVDSASPFGFEIVGADIAMLKPATGAPQTWPLSIEPLYDGKRWIMGAAAARDGDEILLLAAEQPPSAKGHAMALLRLTGATKAWRLETQDTAGAWRPLPQTEPRRLFDDGSSEAGLLEGRAGRGWLAVHTEGGMAMPHVMARTAPNPAGPWSPPASLYRFPEMTPGNARYREGVFCYAAKAHAEFPDERGLLITYACNSAHERELREDMTIYRPRLEWIESTE